MPASVASNAWNPASRSSKAQMPMWPIRKIWPFRGPCPPATTVPCFSRSSFRKALSSTPTGYRTAVTVFDAKRRSGNNRRSSASNPALAASASRRGREALLGAHDERVDSPRLHAVLETAHRGDSVDDQERVVLLHDLRDFGDRVREAGGGFVPAQRDRIELTRVKGRGDLPRIDRGPPFERERGRRREDLTELVEPFAELAVHEVQYAVLFAQETGHSGLEPGGAGPGKDGDLTARPEEILCEPADLGQDLFELRAAVIHRGSRHRLEDTRMHLDGSREEERARSALDHARTMDREAINDSSSLSVPKDATTPVRPTFVNVPREGAFLRMIRCQQPLYSA